MDLLKEIHLQNATKNSDVANVENVGELLIPSDGYWVSVFPFCILSGLPRLQCHLGSCMCFALQLTSSSEILNHHTNPYC